MKVLVSKLTVAVLCLAPTTVKATEPVDDFLQQIEHRLDSIFSRSSLVYFPDFNPWISETDILEASAHLDVEPAALKAVIEIEAGNVNRGILSPGRPIINFNPETFRKRAEKNNTDLTQAKIDYPELFSNQRIKRSHSTQTLQFDLLQKARKIDEKAAIESTFWGMFQIGGFNWRRCGASSPLDFAVRMSSSEHEQLRLFCEFIKNGKMDADIRAKNWTAFARKYNGPGFRSRSYHSRLASAYKHYAAKYKTSEK